MRQQIKDIACYFGLGLLFTHELDAMTNYEWRVLPILRSLPDDIGQIVFVIAHVPLFAVAIAFVASLNPRVRERARDVVSAFLIVHAVLHLLFSGHEAYDFSTVLSSVLIYGAALCGIAYFLTPRADRHADPGNP